MTDPRYKKLASLLVNYSTEIKKGDCALLDMIDVPDEFSLELMRAVRAAGGIPFIEVRHTRISREIVQATEPRHAALLRDLELHRMKKMQAYIAIRGSGNASENSDVPGDRMQLYSRVLRPVLNYRVNHTRWCVLRWPTPSMAQAAGRAPRRSRICISTSAPWITPKWAGRWAPWKSGCKRRTVSTSKARAQT